MKYSIISINDERAKFKAAIRAGTTFEEVPFTPFNAHVDNPMAGLRARGLLLNTRAWPNSKRGELGVWLSNYDAWTRIASDEPRIVFEDDAILNSDFDSKVERLIDELPADWDFAALWVPENQHQDFLYNIVWNPRSGPQFMGYKTPDESVYGLDTSNFAALAYQGYGMVALMYSQVGAAKLVKRAHETNLTGPVDCWIFEQAKAGYVKGYAPRPEYADIVHYDWSADSHVQQTERV